VNFLISPTEPKKLRKLVKDIAIEASFCEENGADFALFTNQGIVLIQRKTISDLVASVDDGRLAMQFSLMREYGDFQVLALEGKPRYRNEQLLLGRRTGRWTRLGFRNLLRSIYYIEGIYIERTNDIQDTIECLKTLQAYFDADKHSAIHVRPRLNTSWLIPTRQERYLFFLQGLPSIKIVRAMALAEVFKSPLELFGADMQALKSVPGIGDVVAEGIYNFLRGT